MIDRPTVHRDQMSSAERTRNVLSMTGQGHAEHRGPLGTVNVEVRTVNNRGFKCVLRTSDSLWSLESRVETLARSMIRRGSVQLNISWRRPPGEYTSAIDSSVLESYALQLKQIQERLGQSEPLQLGSLMTLPGVIVSNREDRRNDEELWEFIRVAIEGAIDNLNDMREIEGSAMAQSLHEDSLSIERRVAMISQLAPRVVENHRSRLTTKVERALAEHGLEVGPVDLLREVQIYADRVDISEEITRLNSHLRMFAGVLEGENMAGDREPSGRKLDFVIQEMFREVNTIGSKASDAEISSHVVEIKCAIERMRELVQNLE